MCFNRRISARIGHVTCALWVAGMAEREIRSAFRPVFWFAICSVAPVHLLYKSSRGRFGFSILLCSQRYTSQCQNGIVCFLSSGGEYVYSPGCSKK